MSNIDEAAGAAFERCISALIQDDVIDRPQDHLGGVIGPFIERHYAAIFPDKTWSGKKGAEYTNLVFQIAQDNHAFRPDFRKHLDTVVDGPRQAVYAIIRGQGSQSDCIQIMLWMLCKFPNFDETIALQRKVFRGETFEKFFGFPPPLDGQKAERQYGEFLKSISSERNAPIASTKDDEATMLSAADNVTALFETKNAESVRNANNEPKVKQWLSRSARVKILDSIRNPKILAFVLAAIMLAGVTSAPRAVTNQIKKMAMPTIELSSDTFPISRFLMPYEKSSNVRKYPSLNQADAAGVLYISPPDPTALGIEGNFSETTGFHGFELLSERSRTDGDSDWPYQYLANDKDSVYGRPASTLDGDDRFRTAHYLQTQELDCVNGTFASAPLSNFQVSQLNCRSFDVEYRNWKDWQFKILDFSTALREHFSLNYPDINAVKIEFDEYQSGLFSAMSATSTDSGDFVLVSKNNWATGEGWGLVFAAQSASVFEIDTDHTGLSVLVHATSSIDQSSIFMLLDHATGDVRALLITEEPTRFFDVGYGSNNRSGLLTIATDNFMFDIAMYMHRGDEVVLE